MESKELYKVNRRMVVAVLRLGYLYFSSKNTNKKEQNQEGAATKCN